MKNYTSITAYPLSLFFFPFSWGWGSLQPIWTWRQSYVFNIKSKKGRHTILACKRLCNGFWKAWIVISQPCPVLSYSDFPTNYLLNVKVLGSLKCLLWRSFELFPSFVFIFQISLFFPYYFANQCSLHMEPKYPRKR